MMRPAPDGFDRLLLAAALLEGTTSALTDDSAADSSGGIVWFVIALVLLWFVRRGSHAAWVASCAVATVGALLFGYAWLADATSTSSFTATENAGPMALVYATTVVLLTSIPVRRLVGRAAEPQPDHERQTLHQPGHAHGAAGR
jgi:hypothetical protein